MFFLLYFQFVLLISFGRYSGSYSGSYFIQFPFNPMNKVEWQVKQGKFGSCDGFCLFDRISPLPDPHCQLMRCVIHKLMQRTQFTNTARFYFDRDQFSVVGKNIIHLSAGIGFFAYPKMELVTD